MTQLWKSQTREEQSLKTSNYGNSLAVQWLGLRSFTAEGQGSIPGWGTKIPHAAQCS